MAEISTYRGAFAAAAAVVIGIGILGFIDLRKAPYAGYAGAQDFDVVRVRPGSPAAEAGLRIGDKIKALDGIQVTDTKALWRRPRAEVGETRTYCVEREGEIVEVDLTFGSVPRRRYIETGLGFLVGLCFVGFTLWAYRSAPGTATIFLALFGLCFGLDFFPAPYVRSFLLRTLGEALGLVVVIAGFAFLIHYLMLFPKRRALLDRNWALWLIYLPAALVALFVLGLIVIQPDFTAAVRLTVSWIFLIFTAGYFGAALVSVVQSYRHADEGELASSGVRMMAIGTFIGVLPLLVGSVVRTIAPSVVLPGEHFLPLLFGLIPITFSLAAVRHHRVAA